jgi:hypothetical protein
MVGKTQMVRKTSVVELGGGRGVVVEGVLQTKSAMVTLFGLL